MCQCATAQPRHQYGDDLDVDLPLRPGQHQSTGLFMNRNGTMPRVLAFGGTANATQAWPNWVTAGTPTVRPLTTSIPPFIRQPASGRLWRLVVQTNQATIYLYYIDPNTSNPSSTRRSIPSRTAPKCSVAAPTPSAPMPRTWRVRSSMEPLMKWRFTTRRSPATRFWRNSPKPPACGTGWPLPSAGSPNRVGTYAGNTVTLTATGINGSSPITYQWQRNGSQSG